MDARANDVAAKIVFALLLAAALAPVLLVRIPATADYPTHLARMYLLAQNGTPDENPFYRVVWVPYPNLAMDLLVPPAARLLGVELASRLFLLLGEILLVAGAFAIERAVKGRVQIAGFAAVMFLYCLPFAWGFVNFEFGLGLALCGIAAMLAVEARPWPLRLLVNAAFVVAVFFAHFFALGVYGATLGLYELWRAAASSSPLRETGARLLVLALPAALVLLAVAASGAAVGEVTSSWLFAYKPLWLFHIMNGYSLPVSAASVVVLAGALYVAFKRGIASLAPAGLWIAVGFLVLYLAIPSRLFATSYADFRIIAAAAFILPAFCSLRLPDRRWLVAALGVVTAITVANLAVVVYVWTSYRADYAELIASFAKIEKNALVLVAHGGEADDPPLRDLLDYPMYNAPALALHYANSFVPGFSAALGKQPVIARAPYRHLVEPGNSGIVPVAALKAIAAGTSSDAPEFLRAWRSDFDYLYVLGPRTANPLPGDLTELYAAPRFVLYAVGKQ
jgi:hypothetical protein